MDKVNNLTDHQLRHALKSFNVAPGPITASTRNVYRKKLASLMEENTTASGVKQEGDLSTSSIAKHEESIASTSMVQEGGDELSPSTSMRQEGDELSTSVIVGSANGISKGILLLVISFFVGIFSYYLYSTKHNLFDPLKPYKNLSKQLLVLLVLSPLGYIVYKTIAYFRLRRHEELQRVCGLVHDALELLQSPDNPKGLMPILHIRDTLLTPSERKTKKMTDLWRKAVKFVEEHESRVKVELVNIDGEDFRAWKWIGTKKP